MLVVTAFVINSLQYYSSQDDEASLINLQKIPIQIGKWKGKELSLDKTIYDILETRAIIHRLFISYNGDNVFLSIVHYSDTKVDCHAPEACLGGRGESISKVNEMITLYSSSQQRTWDIAEIIATRPTGRHLTYYFFKSGQFIGSNYIKMRLSIAANKLAKNDTRGSLIRISTTLTQGNEKISKERLIDFMEDLFPYIQQLL